MRPDEHKKKKNTAYKKKHGIPITKETSDKKDETTKQEKEKSTGGRKDNQQTTKSVQSKTKTQFQLSTASEQQRVSSGASVAFKATAENRSSCSSSSDTETESSSKKKPTKSFRRREIVSNWQKYELHPDEDEKVSSRGESYEKLLSMAGDAISHFRFKDELAWDDSTDGNTNDSYSHLLSVNPAELVQSLSCLPVHQVLGINQDVFPADQLSSLMNVAKDRLSVYSAKILLEESEHPVSPANKNVSTEVSNSSKLLMPHKDNQQNDLLLSLNLQFKDQSTVMARLEQKMVDTSSSLFTPDASRSAPVYLDENDCSNTGSIAKEEYCADSITFKKCNEKLKLQDESLDAILDLDNPTGEVDGDIKDTCSQHSSAMTSSAHKSDIKSDKLVTESADLEAWLDSVLDD